MTAAYPTGGFFGFYIQTPGTGAANIDLATHTASDAVFVRQTTGDRHRIARQLRRGHRHRR